MGEVRQADAPAQARQSFEQALALIAAGNLLDALLCVERALKLEPDDAIYLSYYAMLIALERGQVRRGLELSQSALERAHSHPDVHLNTARIYLKANRKAEAIHCLHAGLELAPEHAEIKRMLAELGVRRRPVLPFLSRRNPLNKYLGLIARRLGLR